MDRTPGDLLMAPTHDHYDVIIIGSGAGGATLAHSLADTGKRILILERGDFLPREKQNWDSVEIWGKQRYRNSGKWMDGTSGKSFTPKQHYYVGGNTKFYGAVLFRMRENDFGEIHHVDGVSPAWPISYGQLEPYYTQAEILYHVHGERGIDPLDPPSESAYPYPAVSDEPRIEQLRADLTTAGLHPFPLPMGIMIDEDRPHESRCVRCETCDGFPCLVQAKADAHVTCIIPALQFENVELLTNALVRKINTDSSGRIATSVSVEVGGDLVTITATTIVLSAGAVNSAVLLLQSASDQHPHGLANSSDQVGRNLMLHNNSSLIAFSKTTNPTKFQKTLGINDYYYGDGEWPYPLGAMQLLGRSDPFTITLDDPHAADPAALAEHSLDFWLTTEDLPLPNNRVTVSESGEITLTYTPTNLEAHQRLIAKFKGLLESMQCQKEVVEKPHYLGGKLGINGVAHQNGTLRFGDDPNTSVLDVNCKAHDLDNLYVVDASFFVSSSAVNPTLTIIANALRVADHLRHTLTA